MLDRHPTINLNQEANLSYRDLRVKLANADVQTVLTASAITPLPTTEAVAGGGYSEIDWPTNAVSIHGVDVKVGGYWTNLQQGNFAQRRLGPIQPSVDYSFASQSDGGAMWIVRSLPTTSGATQVAGKIMLFPTPNSGGSYVVWFLPEWVDIALDTDLFPGQESWLQWVIWDVGCKALVRDIGPSPTAQLQEAEAARERAWMLIRSNSQRLANDGPLQPMSRYGGRRSSGYRLIP
jgi:hypothetical protein